MSRTSQTTRPAGNANPVQAPKELKRLDVEGLSIYRGFVDGPLTGDTFDIDVGYNYTGDELVQIFPVWSGGATPKITQLTTSHLSNIVTVRFQTDKPAQVAQIGYVLFIIP